MLLGSSHCCHICGDGLQAWMNQTVRFFLFLGSPEQAEENHVTEGAVLKFWLPTWLSLSGHALTYPPGSSYVRKPKWLFIAFYHASLKSLPYSWLFFIAYFSSYFTEEIGGHQPWTLKGLSFFCVPPVPLWFLVFFCFIRGRGVLLSKADISDLPLYSQFFSACIHAQISTIQNKQKDKPCLDASRFFFHP